MKTILCLVYILVSTVAFAQEHKDARDPFWPLVSSSGTMLTYDGNVGVSDMVLEGIVTDAQGANLAILNGKVLKVGDLMGAYTVEKILNDEVSLIKGQDHIVVKIKKEVL